MPATAVATPPRAIGIVILHKACLEHISQGIFSEKSFVNPSSVRRDRRKTSLQNLPWVRESLEASPKYRDVAKFDAVERQIGLVLGSRTSGVCMPFFILCFLVAWSSLIHIARILRVRLVRRADLAIAFFTFLYSPPVN